MVTEVINYYINNGSSEYMCMLDVSKPSKASDRVNLLTQGTKEEWTPFT